MDESEIWALFLPLTKRRRMKLTKNFSLEELCVTDTGLPNVPESHIVDRLLLVAFYLLQPTRDRYGPLKVNSGFRSLAVNHKINGSGTSQHLRGEAADSVPLEADIREVYAWMRDNLIYGQIIFEDKDGSQWIHISLPRAGGKNMMAGLFDGLEYLWTKEGV